MRHLGTIATFRAPDKSGCNSSLWLCYVTPHYNVFLVFLAFFSHSLSDSGQQEFRSVCCSSIASSELNVKALTYIKLSKKLMAFWGNRLLIVREDLRFSHTFQKWLLGCFRLIASHNRGYTITEWFACFTLRQNYYKSDSFHFDCPNCVW